jgi:TonB family protein
VTSLAKELEGRSVAPPGQKVQTTPAKELEGGRSLSPPGQTVQTTPAKELESGRSGVTPPKESDAPGAASTDTRPRFSGKIEAAVLIYRKDAEYPKIAKQTGAKGTVTLDVTIGADGNIKKVRVVSGHPMLTNAAVEAVQQWRYRPTLVDGQPVETHSQVLVNFVGDR